MVLNSNPEQLNEQHLLRNMVEGANLDEKVNLLGQLLNKWPMNAPEYDNYRVRAKKLEQAFKNINFQKSLSDQKNEGMLPSPLLVDNPKEYLAKKEVELTDKLSKLLKDLDRFNAEYAVVANFERIEQHGRVDFKNGTKFEGVVAFLKDGSGMPYGKGVLYLTDGREYDAVWRINSENKLTVKGEATVKTPTGEVYHLWHDDIANAQGTMEDADGKSYAVEIVNGVKHFRDVKASAEVNWDSEFAVKKGESLPKFEALKETLLKGMTTSARLKAIDLAKNGVNVPRMFDSWMSKMEIDAETLAKIDFYVFKDGSAYLGQMVDGQPGGKGIRFDKAKYDGGYAFQEVVEGEAAPESRTFIYGKTGHLDGEILYTDAKTGAGVGVRYERQPAIFGGAPAQTLCYAVKFENGKEVPPPELLWQVPSKEAQSVIEKTHFGPEKKPGDGVVYKFASPKGEFVMEGVRVAGM